MAPKTGAPPGKTKNIPVSATKVVEKNKTCHTLLNPVVATPGHSLALGRHRKKQVMRSVKAELHFPVGRIGRYLKEGRYSQRIGFNALVYLMVVLEYLTAEVLELVGQVAKDRKKIRMIPRHVMLGVMRDEDLSKLLVGITIVHGDVLPNIHEALFGYGTAEEAAKFPTEDTAKSPEKTAESP